MFFIVLYLYIIEYFKSPLKKWGLFCVFSLKGVQVTAPNGRNCWNMGKGDSLPYKKTKRKVQEQEQCLFKSRSADASISS